MGPLIIALLREIHNLLMVRIEVTYFIANRY